MSPAQAWFFLQVPASPSRYTHAQMMRLSRGVDRQTLERALNEVLEHHDVFKFRYTRDEDGEWKQDLTRRVPIRLGLGFIAAEMSREQGEVVARETCETIRESIDIESGRLVGAALLMNAELGTQELLVVAHHLVVDGVSWGILGRELRDRITGAGGPTGETALTSFGDWTRCLAEACESSTLAGSAFRDNSSGVPSASLKKTRPLTTSGESLSLRRYTIGQAETDALVSFAAREKLSLEDLLLAGLAEGLRDKQPRGVINVDIELHGRYAPEISLDAAEIVGWLTAIVPVQARWGDGSILDEARRLHDRKSMDRESDVVRGAMAWLGRRRLEETELGGRRVLFTYMGRYRSVGSLEAGTWHPGPEDRRRTVFNQVLYDISCNAWIREGELLLDWWHGPTWTDVQLDNASERIRGVLADVVSAGVLSAPSAQVTRYPSGRELPDVEASQNTEQLILEVWREVLDNKAEWNEGLPGPEGELGLDDNFFLIGGDSLHMIQVASRLRRAAGIRIPLRAMLEYQTPREFAAKLSAVLHGNDEF